MELNLTPVLSREGAKLPIDMEAELCARKEDSFSFEGPVHLSGEAYSAGGGIELRLCIRAALRMSCDRCGREFVREIETDCEERLEKGPVGQEPADTDVIYFSGYLIDIGEIAYRSIYMNLPMKVLCCEGCKGLCPVCGKNLNEGECGCETNPVDPRFDVLDQLLSE